jgi:hypothetical protein
MPDALLKKQILTQGEIGYVAAPKRAMGIGKAFVRHWTRKNGQMTRDLPRLKVGLKIVQPSGRC